MSSRTSQSCRRHCLSRRGRSPAVRSLRCTVDEVAHQFVQLVRVLFSPVIWVEVLQVVVELLEVLSSSMAGMHSSTSGALRRGPLGFTIRGCVGCLRGTVEFLLRSLLRFAFRLPLRRATSWRGRTGRSQCTSYNRFSSGRNGALT